MSTVFPHQRYQLTPPSAPYNLLKPEAGPPPGSEDFASRMRAVGKAFRKGSISAIYLAHGTFTGEDAFGLIGELGRFFPTGSAAIRRVIKELVDAVAGDVGNYSERYVVRFGQAINDDLPEPPIPVRGFHWSSENNHIGRADGAVQLIDKLVDLQLLPGKRVLLWGHSHAGNVFALMSQLLGADGGAR